MPNNKIILLADDHVIIRRGLKALVDNYFGKSIWIETESTNNIIDLMKYNNITHLILDMQLQDGNIMDVISDIKAVNPTVPILIYTMSSEDIFGARMLKMGVNGFLSKQTNEEETLKALHVFFSNRNFISENLQDIILNKKQSINNPIDSLSEREIVVLNYLLQGCSVKEITTKLDLKTSTVATYKARIFDKLGVNNLIDLRNITDIYNFKTS